MDLPQSLDEGTISKKEPQVSFHPMLKAAFPPVFFFKSSFQNLRWWLLGGKKKCNYGEISRSQGSFGHFFPTSPQGCLEGEVCFCDKNWFVCWTTNLPQSCLLWTLDCAARLLSLGDGLWQVRWYHFMLGHIAAAAAAHAMESARFSSAR